MGQRDLKFGNCAQLGSALWHLGEVNVPTLTHESRMEFLKMKLKLAALLEREQDALPSLADEWGAINDDG
jgi:hypothetical protein